MQIKLNSSQLPGLCSPVLLLLFYVFVFVPHPHRACLPEVGLPSLLLGHFLFLEQLHQAGVPSCYLIL